MFSIELYSNYNPTSGVESKPREAWLLGLKGLQLEKVGKIFGVSLNKILAFICGILCLRLLFLH